jgi:hypothetical protein
MNSRIPSTTDHPLYFAIFTLIERLIAAIDEDALAHASLADQTAALEVLCRVLNQLEDFPSEHQRLPQQSQKEVVHIEQQNAQGRSRKGPPGAGADSEHTRAVSSGCVWATLRQDRSRED